MSRDTISSDLTLLSVLKQRATATPTKLIYSFPSTGNQIDLSYADVYWTAQRIAGLLQTQKQDIFRAECRILLWYPSESLSDLVLAFWGCLFCGSIPVIADTTCDVSRQAENIGAQIVLTNRQTIRRRKMKQIKLKLMMKKVLPELTSHLTWLTSDTKAKNPVNDMVTIQTGDEIACLQYSDGASRIDSMPCILSHANLLAAVRQFSWIQSTETMVGWISPCNITGLVQNILVPVYTGCRSVHLSQEEFYKDPIRWLQLVAKYKAVYTHGTSSSFGLVAFRTSDDVAAKIDLRQLRCASVCDERIHEGYLEAFVSKFAVAGVTRARLQCLYGMAETTGAIADTRGRHQRVITISRRALEYFDQLEPLEPNEIESDAVISAESIQVVSYGKPLDDVDLRIVDTAKNEHTLDGIVGEIWVSGPSVNSGIWQNLANHATKPLGPTSFERRVGVLANKKYFRTGDLGVVFDKELYVVGRSSDMYRGNDRWIALNLIEISVELTSSLIPPGSVCCFPDQKDGVVVVANLSLDIHLINNGTATAFTICNDIVRKLRADHEVDVSRILLLRPGQGMIRSRRKSEIRALLTTQNNESIVLDYNQATDNIAQPSVEEGYFI